MADKQSRLAEIYKAEKSKGGGLASTLGKRALEKVDPRQFFNQKGFMAAALPSLFKSYSATPIKSGGKVASLGSDSLSSNALETKLDVLIGETKDVKINSKLSAKNSMVLPDIARDMNVMRQNIQKLVKLQGGTAAKGTDMYFKKSGEREASYESQFGKEKFKTSPTLVGDKKEEKKEGGILGLLSTLFAPLLTLGATIASAITGTLATLFSPDNLVKVFGLGLDVIKGIGTAFRVLLPLLTNPVFLSIVGGLLAAKWLMDLIDKKNSEANTKEKTDLRIAQDRGSQSSKLARRTFLINDELKSYLKDDRTDEELSDFTSGEIRTKDELRAKIAEAEALGKRAIEIKESRVVKEQQDIQHAGALKSQADGSIDAAEMRRFSSSKPNGETQTETPVASTPAPTPAPQLPTTSPTRSSTTPITTGPGGAAFGMYPKPGGKNPLLDVIAQGESASSGGYNAMNQGTPGGGPVIGSGDSQKIIQKKLTDMTVGEIMDKGAKPNDDAAKRKQNGLIFAAGRYQIVPETLKALVKQNVVSKEDKFNEETQDKLGTALIKGTGALKLAESGDYEGAQNALAKTWAAIPLATDVGDKKAGQSFYQKPGQNKSMQNLDVKGALMASSGISSPNQSAALAPNAPSSGTTLAAATTDVSKEKMILASAAPIVNNNVTNNNVNNTTAGGQSQGALPSVYDDMFSSLFQRVA